MSFEIIMKHIIFLIIFWHICSLSFSQSFQSLDWEEPLCHISKGIIKITEKSDNKWTTVYEFDSLGFLITQNNCYKKEERARYRNTYSNIEDSILLIRTKNDLDPNDGIYSKYFFYNKRNFQYMRFEIHSPKPSEKAPNPFVRGHDFIYKDSLLLSYTRNTHTIKYTYNSFGQIVQRSISSPIDVQTTIYKYDEEKRLTDLITTSYMIDSSPTQANLFLGVPTYSETERNRYHIRFTNFDKKGNWIKSFFVTKNGLKYRSKRKIIYQAD